ncbi:MAG: glycosyltransferase [Candidatus Omnitrophica bacterium]|nr:glycosyltransferase [Candidatus Omnitrophota bacterium]
MKALPCISVITPVYNAEKTIEDCIKSLLNQDYPKTRYEVIVVDNNSVDNSERIINSYPVQFIKCVEKGSYVARNMGARNAKGEILAFTDSDCVASKDWLKVIASSFSQNNLVAVQGPGNITLQKNLKVKVECFVRKMTENNFWGDTKNLAVRKDVFNEAGGFKDFFTGCDTLFLNTLILKKYNVKFNKNMVVFHTFPTNLVSLIKKNWKHGLGDVFRAAKMRRLNRKDKLKQMLYTHFRYSLKMLFLEGSFSEKVCMCLYYVIMRQVRSLSYVINSFSRKIRLVRKED